jgi:hypothetical protein
MPVVEQQLEAGEQQKQNGHIMTNAILAGEEDKRISGKPRPIALALIDAVTPAPPGKALHGHRPGDTCNRQSQQKQPDHL